MIISLGFLRYPVGPNDSRTAPAYVVFEGFRQYLQSPVSAAILLDIARSLPVEPIDMANARLNSWNKEISLCEGKSRQPSVKWEVLFNPGLSDHPMIPGILPNRKMALAIYSSLRLWRSKMTNRLLYPSITHKNMSRSTRRDYEDVTGLSLEGIPIFGQDNWERHYYLTGHMIQGVCEMRQKWYPSGIKPRTYYTQGGTTYATSRHLQAVFTDLVNSSPITHHVSRLQPSRLLLKDGSHYRIYDLTSFTSNMHEQKAFCRQLAIFASGVTVYTMDAREGLVPRDLGEMIEDYNEICNKSPELSYERFDSSFEDIISIHGTASMLGIFGNLMTCTMAHGALMAQTVEAEDEVNCAGDDGAVLERKERKEDQDVCVCHLGSYEWSKTFSSDDDGCICLKRPLWEEGSRLHHEIMVIPPNLSLILHLIEGRVDPRFQFFSEDLSPEDRVSTVGKDLMRFLRSVHRAAWRLSSSEIELAIDFYQCLTKKINGFGNLNHGSLPHSSGVVFWPVYPTEDDLRSSDPFELLLISRYNGTCAIPVQEWVELSYEDLEEAGVEVRFGNKTKHLGYLEKLGLLESKRSLRMMTGPEGFDALRRLYQDFSTPLVYEFRLVDNVPTHLRW